MFLLNSILVGNYIDEDNGVLKIEPFSLEHLEHTFYYFRLGSNYTMNGHRQELTNKPDQNELVLEPGAFAFIETLESFTLSDKILGLLGPCSNIIKDGLQLLHSPFIDPKYNKPLKFGIKNLNTKAVKLEYAVSKIGKVSFFDISDTYPMKIRKDSSFAKRFL